LEFRRGKVKRGSVKVERGSVKVERGSAKVERGSVKVERGSVKVERGSAKVKRGSAKVERGSAKVKRGSAKVERGSVKVKRGFAKVERDVVRRSVCARSLLRVEVKHLCEASSSGSRASGAVKRGSASRMLLLSHFPRITGVNRTKLSPCRSFMLILT